MSETNNENVLNESNESSDKDVVNEIVEPKVDSLGRSYATGRRKDSTARVWVKRGTGEMSVNGKTMHVYFDRPVLQMQLNHVFEIVNFLSHTHKLALRHEDKQSQKKSEKGKHSKYLPCGDVCDFRTE